MINYISQVDALLKFISALRRAEWLKHLTSAQGLCPYFHAHDQIRYSRWEPLYIADMIELQSTDPEIWTFLSDGNFVISKHEIPFTCIDPDHAIEQEHNKNENQGRLHWYNQ